MPLIRRNIPGNTRTPKKLLSGMKSAIRTLLLLALSARVVSAQQRYYIQPNDQSRLELRVFKTGLYRGKFHTFLFPSHTGMLLYNAHMPEESRIELRFDAGSIKCVDTWLNAKDLKAVQQYALVDMLAAERYPAIVFVSSEIHAVDKTRFEVVGMLTIRGLAKPARVDVTLQQVSDEA